MALEVKSSLVWSRGSQHKVLSFIGFVEEKEKYYIWDENGNWCDTNESIAAITISYFETLFTTSYPSRISEVTDMIPIRVADELNQRLISTYTREEVGAALKQMHSTKAPRPMVCLLSFFKNIGMW